MMTREELSVALLDVLPDAGDRQAVIDALTKRCEAVSRFHGVQCERTAHRVPDVSHTARMGLLDTVAWVDSHELL